MPIDRNQVVRAGKCRGRTYSAAFAEERNYAMFVLDKFLNAEDGGPLSEYAAYVAQETDALGGENLMTFGKHAGETYSWMLANEPSYGTYLIRTLETLTGAPKHFATWFAGQEQE